MRTISTLVIILLSIPAIGQGDSQNAPCDCPYAFNNEDIRSAEVDRSLVPVKIGSGFVSSVAVKATVSQFGEVYKIHLFYPGDLDCISSRSHAIFKFIDGTEIDLEHSGYEDCDGELHFVAKVFDELGSFRTLAIDKIRLYGSEAHDDLNIEAGTYFMDAFNCCIF